MKKPIEKGHIRKFKADKQRDLIAHLQAEHYPKLYPCNQCDFKATEPSLKILLSMAS